MNLERILRWALVAIAIAGLAVGIVAHVAGRPNLADLCWTLATVPVVADLAVSIARDFYAGRLGVDAIALVSMSAALVLRQPLAGAVVALMYSGGNVLEEIAVARAENDLRSLVDRAPRVAHRRVDDGIEDVPVAGVAAGDRLLARAGEVVPVDGVVTSHAATIDESALSGEPIPVVKTRGTATFSGSLNAGETAKAPKASSKTSACYWCPQGRWPCFHFRS
jgi:cation transport ATPase